MTLNYCFLYVIVVYTLHTILLYSRNFRSSVFMVRQPFIAMMHMIAPIKLTHRTIVLISQGFFPADQFFIIMITIKYFLCRIRI